MTELCKTGLPVNWCYIQYNRGALTLVEDDEFRFEKTRMLSENNRVFEEERWGFGRTDLNFWLLGNNGSATEAAEALYYIHLYRVRAVNYMYLGIPWRSRVIHDSLATFEPLGLAEFGTGFAITWRAQLFVPVLRQEIQGFNVQEICNEIFDSTLSIDINQIPPFPSPMGNFDETKSVFLDVSVHSHFDETLQKVVIEEVEGRCNE